MLGRKSKIYNYLFVVSTEINNNNIIMHMFIDLIYKPKEIEADILEGVLKQIKRQKDFNNITLLNYKYVSMKKI